MGPGAVGASVACTNTTVSNLKTTLLEDSQTASMAKPRPLHLHAALQGYVKQPKRTTFTLVDSMAAGLHDGSQPPQQQQQQQAELDVFTSSLKPREEPSDRWPGLQLSEGDYVLVVGKLRAGRAGPGRQAAAAGGSGGGSCQLSGSQQARLGITAHKVGPQLGAPPCT